MELRFAQTLLSKFKINDIIISVDQNKTAEYYIPDIVTTRIQSKEIAFSVIPTNDSWFGVTYKEDKQMVVDTLNNHIKNSVYPVKIWN